VRPGRLFELRSHSNCPATRLALWETSWAAAWRTADGEARAGWATRSGSGRDGHGSAWGATGMQQEEPALTKLGRRSAP